jgi:hypothetical protein
MPNRLSRRISAACAISIVALSAAGTVSAQAGDPIVFSFATLGDSRTDPNKPDPTTLLTNPNPSTQGGVTSYTGTILPQDNVWVQNTLALGTILNGIQAQNPNLLFFNGDMIFGYGRPTLPAAWAATGKPNSWNTAQTVSPDAIFQYQQYAYWRGMIANLFLNGTYVLPVPGNHETQCSFSAAPYNSTTIPNPGCDNASQGNLSGKTAYADNENMFRFNTSDLVQDLVTNLRFSNVTGYFATNVNGLTQATAPASSANNGPISSDQHDLSYSFDIQAQPGLLLHFAVINTDPAGADSIAPADWLASDFAAAKARGAAKFFVFGHKPAFTYNYSAASGVNLAAAGLDATVNAQNVPTFRNTFWSVITQYGATYFCGHEHTVNVAQYADPTGTYPGAPYQVIVGSGGSPFDDKMVGTCPNCTEPKLTNAFDRYYAWALVSVHQSGKVSLQVNGFDDHFGIQQDLHLYDVAALQ